jgi:glycine cleavage system H protein
MSSGVRLSGRQGLLKPGAQQLTRALSIKFSKSHEFAKLDGDVATVGITDHAAGALGDIVFVDLPSIGAKYAAGDTFGSVESVKAASDVYAPIAGEVLEVNSVLEDTPGKVNESPFKDGWFIKLKVGAQGKSEHAKLLDEKAYKALLEEEKH